MSSRGPRIGETTRIPRVLLKYSSSRWWRGPPTIDPKGVCLHIGRNQEGKAEDGHRKEGSAKTSLGRQDVPRNRDYGSLSFPPVCQIRKKCSDRFSVNRAVFQEWN